MGFLQQPGGGLYISGHWDPEELSSLHSSPSPIHRHPFSSNASPTDPEDLNGINAEFELDLDAPKRSKQDQNTSEKDSNKHVQSEPQGYAKADSGPLQDDLTEKALTQQEWPLSEGKQNFPETYFNLSNSRQRRCSTSDSWLSSPELDGRRDRKSMNTESRGMTHNNNNHIRLKGSHRDKSANSPQPRDSKSGRVLLSLAVMILAKAPACLFVYRNAAVCSV